jgi:hypothetical protein
MIAALLIVLLPFALAWLVLMVLFVGNDPSEEILHARHDRFLGLGGPDDPFANGKLPGFHGRAVSTWLP